MTKINFSLNIYQEIPPLLPITLQRKSVCILGENVKIYLSSLIIAVTVFLSCNRQVNSPAHLLSPPTGEPLELLMQGNMRFMEHHPIHPDQTLERMRELKKGQAPFAVVVSCSDSRVPPELIFDQGLGDIFVIRNAGNIIGEYELGSIEYAVEHLHTPLVIVLGHQNCGAIAAFIEHKHDTLHNHIQSIINYIKSEPEEIALSDTLNNYFELAVKANIHHGVTLLKNSEPVLGELHREGKLKIKGALYDIETGEVNLLDE